MTMAGIALLRPMKIRSACSLIGNRLFSRTPRSLCELPELKDRHSPSPFDKKMLVWSKMFPTQEAVPETISYSTMKKGRDLMRIRINIGMAVATLFGCVGVISYARHKRGSGDSLQSRGLKFEADMRKKGQQEAAEREAQGTR